MPLKHLTETRFVALLGLVMALTGLLIASLPALPSGIVPFGVVFALAFLYPVLLYPKFRRDRADYTFRMLHWAPAMLLTIWLLLQILPFFVPSLITLSAAFSWSWTLIPVAIGFFLLIWFCLHVIRRRKSRLILLGGIFVPFAAIALFSTTSDKHFEQSLAAALWHHDIFAAEDTADLTVAERRRKERIEDRRNLEHSEDPKEEAWRESLRAVISRDKTIEEGAESSQQSSKSMLVAAEISSDSSEGQPTEMPADSELPDTLAPGGTGAHIREVETAPVRLPSSGFGFGAIALTFIGGYFGVLHDRARKRV